MKQTAKESVARPQHNAGRTNSHTWHIAPFLLSPLLNKRSELHQASVVHLRVLGLVGLLAEHIIRTLQVKCDFWFASLRGTRPEQNQHLITDMKVALYFPIQLFFAAAH